MAEMAALKKELEELEKSRASSAQSNISENTRKTSNALFYIEH